MLGRLSILAMYMLIALMRSPSSIRTHQKIRQNPDRLSYQSFAVQPTGVVIRSSFRHPAVHDQDAEACPRRCASV